MQRDQDPVAGAEVANGRTDRIENADALMAENASGCARCHVAFEDVEVRPANRRLHDFHDRVSGSLDLRLRTIFDRLAPRSAIDERFHESLPCLLLIRLFTLLELNWITLAGPKQIPVSSIMVRAAHGNSLVPARFDRTEARSSG